MSKPPRIYVRPLTPGSLLEKVFRRVRPVKRQVPANLVHPMIVAADLRRGSLSSLVKYLAQDGLLPDREVASALQNLITGSAKQTQYRLVVTDHPDLEKDKGGRAKSGQATITERHLKIVARFEEEFAAIGKKKEAVIQTAEAFDVHPSTVSRALKNVELADLPTESNGRQKT